MEVHIHQTHHAIADFSAIEDYIKTNLKSAKSGIHVFPELFLTGYPLQDLCLQKPFISRYNEFLSKISSWIKKNIDHKTTLILMGGLHYELTDSGIAKKIRNITLQNCSKKGLKDIYSKRLLPNYDIFDEKKYFTKGHSNTIIEFNKSKIGILICEDMWASSFHDLDPVKSLKEEVENKKTSLDLVVNLSASPYILQKDLKRIERAKEISHLFQAPFIYCNKVGGEDEILFDGQSFIVNGDSILTKGKRFIPEIITHTIKPAKDYNEHVEFTEELTWESLFNASLDYSTTPPKLKEWNDNDCQEVLEALVFGFRDYANKNNFNKFTIALSGGMDSALVLTILRLALTKGQTLEAVYMPSVHSSTLSYDLSMDLCDKLGISLKSLPIKFLHSTAKNLFTQSYQEPFEGLTDENIQSRLRGVLLYTRSNQLGSMVVNTSNKSELAVGYSTQYGDSVGAISLLGDLYKSQVYRLAEYINKAYGNLIPEKIITREPTAELREGQIDTESLPAYEHLDAILECLLNYRFTAQDILKLGFSQNDVQRTINLYRKTEYKRYQFCPIVKISSKSFGFGYRIPLSKDTDFYQI